MLRRITFYSLSLFISLSASPALGQTWQSQYDLAVKAYQAGDYEKAMTTAAVAIGFLQDSDKKNKAYTLQLITASSLDAEQPAEGLRWIAQESQLFLELDGPKSRGYTEAKCKHARLLVSNTQLGEAEGKCREALDALRAAMPEGSVEYNDINFLYAQVLASNAKLPEALMVADQCVEAFARDAEKGAEYIEAVFLSAQLSEKLKDLPAAEKRYKQLTQLLEKNGLTDQPAYGQAQASLSRIALASGNKAEASKLVSSTGVADIEKAKQLMTIALGYQSSGQHEQALEQYRLAEKAVADGNLQNNTAFSIHVNFGRLLTREGKFKDAEQSLAVAAKLSSVLYHEPSAELAMLNYSQGDLAIAQEKSADASRLYEKARSNAGVMTLQARLPYTTNAARKLLTRSLVQTSIVQLQPDILLLPDKSVTDKDFLEAVLTYTQALTENNQADAAITKLKDLQGRTPSIDNKLQLQSQQASVLEQAGRWTAALSLLAEINKQPNISKNLKIENDYLAGRLYLQLGNFGDAEKHLMACADAIRASSRDSKTGLMLDVSNSLAILYTRLGNYSKAESMFMDLLKQPERSPGFHASVQQNLAALFVESARFTEAELLLEDVLSRDLALYGDQHPMYASSLQNLGAVYLKGHLLDKARAAYEKALQINARTGHGLQYATTAANLGVVYHQSGDLAKAKQFISDALTIREKMLGSDHPDYVFNEYNLAKLLEEMGESQNALPHFRHVASFHLREIKELFRAMSEREKTAYYNKTNEVITAYIDFAIKHSSNDKTLLAELYDFRLATKALLLSSSTKVRSRILSSQDSQLLESYTSWLTTKEELGKLYSLSAEERNNSKAIIMSLQEKANQLEKLLTAQSELFGQDASQDTVTWRSVRRSLSPGDAAIEVIRIGLRKKDSVLYAAIVLRPESAAPQLVVFPHSPRLETKEFRFYRNSIQHRQANERSYEYYWKPLESVLKGVKRIYISPDGVFNKVNVSTLYDPIGKEFLLERHTIELVSNTKELVKNNRSRQAEHFASLFGHPKYGSATQPANRTANGGTRSLAQEIIKGGIQDLPGTLDEVNRVDAFLKGSSWRTSVFVSEAASEKAIREQKNPGILHIATHGYFVQTEDDVQVVGGGDLNQSENNPLLHSGLILAGAGNAGSARSSTDDGILTAYEAMSLTLDKTDLVVLSACETGSGEIKNGEGVYGLQRSFLVAGAANLLMSLWKVDDTATQELMLQFYKELQTTNDKSTAFRATQLEIRKRHPDPYYWGGFVLIGHN